MARQALRTTLNLEEQSPRDTDFERHRSIVVLSEDDRSLRRGFTIVELLIVVVVIAILAAITIVSYNGLSNRAKNSAASSAAAQAVKKVMAYATLNADQYPSTLTDAGVSGGSATYQYRADNSANPRTFCVTATAQNVSYFGSNVQTTPTSGACVGHGANGETVLTNLVLNPSAETDLASISTWSGSTISRVASSNGSGAWAIRVQTSGAVAQEGISYSTSDVGNVHGQYSGSVTAWGSGSVRIWFRILFSDGSAEEGPSSSSTLSGSPVKIATSATFSDKGKTSTGLLMFIRTNSVQATTFNVDGAIVVSGSLPAQFADGNSPGWGWTSVPNNSSSTGPPL